MGTNLSQLASYRWSISNENFIIHVACTEFLYLDVQNQWQGLLKYAAASNKGNEAYTETLNFIILSYNNTIVCIPNDLTHLDASLTDF